MYWQKRLERGDPDTELLRKIREIRKANKDYGYRRIHGELRKQGIPINKKRVHRIVQNMGCRSHPLPGKAANSAHIKVSRERLPLTESIDASKPEYLIRK